MKIIEKEILRHYESSENIFFLIIHKDFSIEVVTSTKSDVVFGLGKSSNSKNGVYFGTDKSSNNKNDVDFGTDKYCSTKSNAVFVYGKSFTANK